MEALGHAEVIQFFRGDPEWDDVLAAFSTPGIGIYDVRVTAEGTLGLSSILLDADTIARVVQTSALAGSGATGQITVEYLYDPSASRTTAEADRDPAAAATCPSRRPYYWWARVWRP